jgi:hypothetical protein
VRGSSCWVWAVIAVIVGLGAMMLYVPSLMPPAIAAGSLSRSAHPSIPVGSLRSHRIRAAAVGSQTSCHRPSFYVIPASSMTRK